MKHIHTYRPIAALVVTLIVFSACNSEDTTVPILQVVAEDAAWTWFNDERAIFAGSDLYIGYVDSAGYSSVTVYPMDEHSEPQSYQLSSFQEVDDHNNPAFIELDDGRVMAAYAPHHTNNYWYRRFAKTTESDSVHWSAEYQSEPQKAKTTYSNLVQLDDEDGRLYNFFRSINFDPVFTISNDSGQSWSAAQHLITSGGSFTRPYVKYATNGSNRIDMLYTQAHPRDAATDIYHVYYKEGNLYQSNGEQVQPLPDANVDPMPMDNGTKIYDAVEAGRAWVWDLEYTADGAPVAVYITARDSTTGNDLRYRYARWDTDTSQWKEHEIAFAGTHLYDGENHYAGGITIDPSAHGTVYTSSDIHPSTGDTTEHYQIYRGTSADSGSSWSWTAITPEATTDNIRPFVPRGAEEHRAVLWLRGTYTTYQKFDTDVVGIFE